MSNPQRATTLNRPHRMLTVCGGTNVGSKREANRDTFVIADLESGQVSRPCIRTDVWVSRPGVLMLVCDGTGDLAAGDGAADLAAASIKQGLEAEGNNVGQAPGYSLKRAVLRANKAILAEVAAHPEESGIATTCTAAIVSSERLAIAQVGDSRAYLFRDGRLHVLTRDQTIASELMDAGGLNAGDADHVTSRRVLTQALGTRVDVQPVITDVDLWEGDRVLLCSNGLYVPVNDDTIAAIMRGTPDISEISQALIAAALAAGGSDNVTVVAADCGPLTRRTTPPQ
jgi:serine/threonine protein phosphatase PrpC